MGNKVLSNQRVTVLAGLSSGITVWANPSLAELTALTNVSGAVNWNSFDLGIRASDQQDDRTLTDGAGSQSRGFTNFGGNLQFVMPAVTDLSGVYRASYNLFSTPRVELVVAVRYGKLNSLAPAASDRFTIFRLTTDAVSFGQGDVSKYFQVALMARDDVLVEYIVPPAVAVVSTITALAAAATIGNLIFASALYQGWDITKGAVWVSSDETKLALVHPGIFRAVAAGTPTILARYPGALNSATTIITVT